MIFQKAEILINESVNTMLKDAENKYDISGDSTEASELVKPLLNILPQNSQFYTNVRDSINKWQKEEESNKSKLDHARAELAKSNPNWNQAYNTANSVTTTYYQKLAEPLKDQAFHGNNKSRFESAKAQYNEGNLKGAVDLVKQIPSNASIYSEASNFLSEWQSELNNLEADVKNFLEHYFEEDINNEQWEDGWNHLSYEFQRQNNNSDVETYKDWWRNKKVYIKTINLLETRQKSTLVKVTYSIDDQDKNKSVDTNTVWCLREDNWYGFKFETRNFCQ